MEPDGRTLALVGATGGAGTTRLAVEFGATLARAGRDVAVVDAAFATQGLAAHVPGRIDPDVTALLVEDGDLGDALVDYPVSLPGRLAVAPARAPFERLARAKTAGAASRFADLVAGAAAAFDYVLLDVPPVAANQALAAVTAADRRALVVPATERGADALLRARDRLADVGAPADLVVANRAGPENPVESADVAVPESDGRSPAAVPVCADPDATFAPAVAAAVEAATGASLGLEFPGEGRLERYLPDLG